MSEGRLVSPTGAGEEGEEERRRWRVREENKNPTKDVGKKYVTHRSDLYANNLQKYVPHMPLTKLQYHRGRRCREAFCDTIQVRLFFSRNGATLVDLMINTILCIAFYHP